MNFALFSLASATGSTQGLHAPTLQRADAIAILPANLDTGYTSALMVSVGIPCASRRRPRTSLFDHGRSTQPARNHHRWRHQALKWNALIHYEHQELERRMRVCVDSSIAACHLHRRRRRWFRWNPSRPKTFPAYPRSVALAGFASKTREVHCTSPSPAVNMREPSPERDVRDGYVPNGIFVRRSTVNGSNMTCFGNFLVGSCPSSSYSSM